MINLTLALIQSQRSETCFCGLILGIISYHGSFNHFEHYFCFFMLQKVKYHHHNKKGELK